MPIYEYICLACAHEFDEIQKFSDPAITKCPSCKKNKVTKKVSLSGFALKGEGWYKDGYARPSDKKSSDSKTPAAKTTETTTPKKSEVKSTSSKSSVTS